MRWPITSYGLASVSAFRLLRFRKPFPKGRPAETLGSLHPLSQLCVAINKEPQDREGMRQNSQTKATTSQHRLLQHRLPPVWPVPLPAPLPTPMLTLAAPQSRSQPMAKFPLLWTATTKE